MKRYSLLTLLLLTLTLSASAAVTFTDKSNYPNLVFTVLDEDAKTVSVKAESISYYGPDSILNIPASVTNSGYTYTVTTIAADGFKAIKIKQIILPSTIKTIEYQALRNISTSFTIELTEGLEEIGERAFTNSKLAEITLPKSVTNIGSAAFFGCSPLVKMTILPTKVPTLTIKSSDGKYPVFPLSTTIIVPTKTAVHYRASNNWQAFKITEIEEINYGALCYKILTDTTVAVTGTFGGISETLTIPDMVSSEGRDYIVSEIADSAFAKQPIHCLKLSNSLRRIGKEAFRDITSSFTIEINEGLIEIGDRAFCKSTGMTGNLVLPSTLQKIGSSATFLSTSIDSIVIKAVVPPTLKNEATYPLPSVPILIPCNTWKKYATAWTAYKQHLVDSCFQTTLVDNIFYVATETGAMAFDYLSLPSGELIFPKEVTINNQLLDVVAIGDSSFIAANITKIVLPSSVTSIGTAAFRNIKSTSFTVEFNEGLIEIGDRAFCTSTGLTGNIVLPSTLQTIGSSATFYNTSIDSFTLKSRTPPVFTKGYEHNQFPIPSVPILIPCESWANYAKVDNYGRTWNAYKSNLIDPCTKLIDNLYYTATDAGAVVVGYDTIPAGKLVFPSEVTINELSMNVVSVGEAAFRDIKSTTFNVEFNEGLITIGERAFTNSTALSDTLVIPSSVQHIGAAAFNNCTSVTYIQMLPITPPSTIIKSVNDSAFRYIYSHITVPCGSMNAYQNAYYWKDLSSKFVSACKPLNLTKGVALTQDTIVSSITFSRTFDMDVWQTLYLPFEVDSVLVEEIDEGKPYYFDINDPYDHENGGYFYLNEYYTTNAEEATITFSTATTLEGFTPYLIQFPQISSDGYFDGKNIIFKSKPGEYTLKKSDYTQPDATKQFQVSGNSSVYNQSVSDMYIFRATLVTGKDGTPLKTVDGKDSVKYDFNRQASATLKPFEFGLLPYVVEPSSGISSAPMRMSLRIGRGSGNTGGGDITTSVSETLAPNAITYRTGAGELALRLNGLPCQLYSVSGTLLYSSTGGTEEITIPLEKGIYILYSEGKSQKIVL